MGVRIRSWKPRYSNELRRIKCAAASANAEGAVDLMTEVVRKREAAERIVFELLMYRWMC